MDTTRDIPTPELLLQVMELASLGAQTRSQLAKQLRRQHPLARLDRRMDGVLRVLESEGLVSSATESAVPVHRTTQAGLAVLEQKGRYSTAAAVLFTDIAASTELIGDVGEMAAHELRQRHFALLRRVIERFKGREVKNLGDGLMVVFAKSSAAIACASAMQQAVADDSDGLGLRVGVHEGELLRDGDDYFGSTVIIARRLCDSAQPGQTIASRATCDPASEPFVPLGELSLKGLSESVDTASVLWSRAAVGAAV